MSGGSSSTSTTDSAGSSAGGSWGTYLSMAGTAMSALQKNSQDQNLAAQSKQAAKVAKANAVFHSQDMAKQAALTVGAQNNAAAGSNTGDVNFGSTEAIKTYTAGQYARQTYLDNIDMYNKAIQLNQQSANYQQSGYNSLGSGFFTAAGDYFKDNQFRS